ncbi:hypothetical protein DFS34DRAFT_351315 [Phlyctochytrium arcticum]|nr:hypothetical protein DFS34DRAFT_351315 [Phlyctochytrium arcticum]
MSTMNENERTVRAQNEQTIRATSIVGSSSAYPSFIQSIPAFSTDNTNTNYLLNADQLLYLMNDSENTVRASSSSPHVGSAPTSSFQHPLQQLHSTPPTPEHESPHVGGELFDTNTPHYNDSSLGSLHQHLASLSDPYTTVRRRDTSRPPSIFPMKAGVTSVGFSSNWLDEQADVQPPVQEPEQFGAVWPPETVFGVTPGLHSQYFFTPDPTQR